MDKGHLVKLEINKNLYVNTIQMPQEICYLKENKNYQKKMTLQYKLDLRIFFFYIYTHYYYTY